MIERKKKRTAKIATFAVAHEVYFKQFEGLCENLLKYHEDFILVGHDGPHHLAIAEGRPILRSLKKYHGKPGSGASVEFKIKEGPITMLGITRRGTEKLNS